MYQRKLSNYIINKTFQFKYAAVAVSASFVSLGVLWFCMWRFHQSGQGLELTPDLQAAVEAFARYVTVRAAIFAVSISVLAIILSHRMAGPLYRFQKTLEAVTEGDLTARANLRLGDDLNDVKDALNSTLASLHVRVRQDKEMAQKAAKSLENIRQQMKEPSGSQDLQGLILQLQKVEQDLHEIGKRFKL